MSEVFHSAGVPGADRCSESATGTDAHIPAGDPQRAALAHECACEIDALARVALSLGGTRHDDTPLALRGLLLRILALTDAQVALLGIGEMPAHELAELHAAVMGAAHPLQGVQL